MGEEAIESNLAVFSLCDQKRLTLVIKTWMQEKRGVVAEAIQQSPSSKGDMF